MQYRVYIDANPHHMDTSTRAVHGVFDTSMEAVAAAREVISARLIEAHRRGMNATELLAHFVRCGEMPLITPEDEHSRCDRIEFARERAKKLCWREELRSSDD